MTGTVRLMDGTILPFAYVDGRFAYREDADTIGFDEIRDSPANGTRGMTWPFEGYIIMVEVEGDRVRRWTWPGVVLSDSYHINDHRYLEAPVYERQVEFPGLHCVVDVSSLPLGWIQEIVADRDPHFPGHAVYVGHYTDDFLAQAPTSAVLAVFAWNATAARSQFVSVIAQPGVAPSARSHIHRLIRQA